MASLHLPYSSSTPYFSTDHHHQQTFHRTTHLPSFHKPLNQSNNSNFSLSFSLPISYSRNNPIKKTNKFSHFIVRFSSSATQDPVLESQSEAGAKTEEGGEQEEEFSTIRVLASNIPWSCTPEDIRALFEKFGTVVDVELSMYNKLRNRGLAFVTMGSAEEAAAAIQNLDTSEFEGRTLRMNYAKIKKKKPLPPPPAPKPVSTFNLFVANLSFEAKSKDLKEFFVSDGADIVSAEIVYHNHDKPRKPSGYGFVAFKTKKEAEAALSTFADKVFMGRPIRVARSRQFVRQPREATPQSDDPSTELDSGAEQADTTNDS